MTTASATAASDQDNVEQTDVLVIGAGMAGLCAAIAARHAGASVIVLEKAPEAERGGNTRFSNGAIRAVYHGVEDIDALVGGLSASERERSEFGSYSREQYYDDLARVTQYRSHPDMADMLVENSRETLFWLQQQGLRFLPLYEWQFKLPDGRIRFSGGSALEVYGAGEGASEALFRTAERSGARVFYRTKALSLIDEAGRITGVIARKEDADIAIRAQRVVLACGGFEANVEWRTRYIGPSWDLAKVRGSRFNTGDGLRMALDRGAMPFGNWSGCHSASWDLNAPDVNELEFGAVFKRDDYLEGIVVNADGERFFDEGADIRALTYAKLGRAILAQPGQVAWQIFDKHGAARLHGEYRVKQSARYQGRHDRGARRSTGWHEARGLSCDHRRFQRGRAHRHSLRSRQEGWPLHARPRHPQIELGARHRRAAVRGLRGDLRHHLHFWRSARRCGLLRARRGRPAHQGPSRRG